MGGSSQVHPLACTYMYGSTAVFTCNEEAMRIFHTLIDSVTIQVQEGKALCFFVVKPGEHADVQRADVVALYWDGTTLVPSSYNDYRVRSPMRLRGSPGDGCAGVFAAIRKFIGRSLKGVKQSLATSKQALDTLKAQRTEDMFNYLSDMPPLPGREDIHDLLLNQAEITYVKDMRMINSCTNELAGYASIIKSARNQMPVGRKGVPIRNGYLASPALVDMLDFFGYTRIGNQLEFHFKKDLVLEGIYYGRPILTVVLTLDKRNARDNSYISSVLVRSADKQAFMHPHIEGTNRWCLGTYIMPINNALIGGNIPLATSLLWQYISRYNDESPLISLELCRTSMASARPRDIIIRRK
jgi:hypothetical protein